ncbi:MAG: hypothetical protein AAF500_06975 [Myxococcota bacterium]
MNADLSIEGVEQLQQRVIGHGMLVLVVGLVAGVMLTFSLLGAVALWPFPTWEVGIPGSTRGWVSAHVGGILNGVMIAGLALLMGKLELRGGRAFWTGWGLIIVGWGNTLFYWAANFSANRGLSPADTSLGAGGVWAALAYVGGVVGMVFAFIAVIILARAAFERARG